MALVIKNPEGVKKNPFPILPAAGMSMLSNIPGPEVGIREPTLNGAYGGMPPQNLNLRPNPADEDAASWEDGKEDNLGQWLRRFKLEQPPFEKKLESFGLTVEDHPGVLMNLTDDQIASTGLFARTLRQLISCLLSAGIIKQKPPPIVLEAFEAE
jgi:hypothetical protein